MNFSQFILKVLFTNVSSQPWIAQNWGWFAGIGLAATILLNLFTRSNIKRSTKIIRDAKGRKTTIPVMEIRGDQKESNSVKSS